MIVRNSQVLLDENHSRQYGIVFIVNCWTWREGTLYNFYVRRNRS